MLENKGNSRETYLPAEIEIVRFHHEDIIVTSGNGGGGGKDHKPGCPCRNCNPDKN